jgi:hypothetical protein
VFSAYCFLCSLFPHPGPFTTHTHLYDAAQRSPSQYDFFATQCPPVKPSCQPASVGVCLCDSPGRVAAAGVCPRPSLCPSLEQQEQQLHPACAAISLSPRPQQQSVSRRARFAAGWAAAVAFRGKVAARAPAFLLLSLTSRNSSCSCLCRSLSLSGGHSGEQAGCAAGRAAAAAGGSVPWGGGVE